MVRRESGQGTDFALPCEIATEVCGAGVPATHRSHYLKTDLEGSG